MKLAFAVLLASFALQDKSIKIETAKPGGFAKLVARTSIYEIRSDADPESLKVATRMLEDLHAAFVAEFKDHVRMGEERMQVAIYATYASFQKENPRAMGAGGFYDPATRTLHAPLKQPNGDDWKLVLKHEGTHQLLHQRMGIGGGQPGVSSSVWFNEGFASYWATARWDGKKAAAGDSHPMLLREFRSLDKSKQLLPLRRLIEAGMDPMSMRTLYTQGWALCHFLRHGRYKDRFGGWLDTERKGEIGFDTFKKAIGFESADEFDKEVSRHIAALK